MAAYRQVDQLQALLSQEGTDGLGRICVTERPDILAKLRRPEGCGDEADGSGCDWEGDMDGAFGESERVVKVAGVASGGALAGLEDRAATWNPGAWRHRLVVLRPGSTAEEQRRVVGNESTTLEVEPGWTRPPRVGERYEIRGSFDPAWVKRVPRTTHERTVRELWTNERSNCGLPGAARLCRTPAEPLDPFHAGNRRSWGNSRDREAITALATVDSVPALYGPVLDAQGQESSARHGWEDPHFGAAAVVMNVADPAYREWRIRYLMYKLRDYGISPGEPACISLTYKPGWYTHYDEGTRGPSGDRCAVAGSGLWTGPAHVCGDGSAPGGPLASGLYRPGEYERAVNAYIRESIAALAEAGWKEPRIVTVERPSFTSAKWSILDEDVRTHPAVIGEWSGAIEPSLAELRNRAIPRSEAQDAPIHSSPTTLVPEAGTNLPRTPQAAPPAAAPSGHAPLDVPTRQDPVPTSTAEGAPVPAAPLPAATGGRTSRSSSGTLPTHSSRERIQRSDSAGGRRGAVTSSAAR